MLFSYYKKGCSILLNSLFLLLSNHIATFNILLTCGNKPPFFHYLSHIPPQAFYLQPTLLILYPTILTYKTTDMSR